MTLTILDYNSGGVYIYENFPISYKPYAEDYITDVLQFNLGEICYMIGSQFSMSIENAELDDDWFLKIKEENGSKN